MKKILIIREFANTLDDYNVFSYKGNTNEEFKTNGFDLVFEDIAEDTEIRSYDSIFTEIINKFINSKFDLIVIPSWIRNPHQYNGLKLAMHWRLSKITSNYAPILIYGFEDELEVFKKCDTAIFLNTDKVFYQRLKYLDLLRFLKEFVFNEEADFDINKNLKYFFIKPPTNYRTAHSITNEWSILKWARTLGLNENTKAFKSIENSIDSLLYYKYLRSYHELDTNTKNVEQNLKEKGKVLFIDDELNKGWELVFKKITSDLDESKVDFLGHDFKKYDNPDEIIDEIIERAKSFDPDVIILDLRLHDSDYEIGCKIEDATGYKALAKIKEYNRGIQVIILTASNKVWNLQALQEKGADGFIVKESPENSSDVDFTKRSLENIFCTLDECLLMSDLKLIANKIKIIKNQSSGILLSPVNRLILNPDFILKSEINLEVAYKLFDLSRKNSKYRNFAFLQLFQILESFADECFQMIPSKGYCIKTISQDIFVLKETHQKDKSGNNIFLSPLLNTKGNYKIEKEGHQEELGIRKEPDTKFKVSALLIYVFGLEKSAKWNWDTINFIRNNYTAHGGKDNYIEITHIDALLIILSYIFDPKLQVIEKNLKYSILNINKGNTPFDGLKEIIDNGKD